MMMPFGEFAKLRAPSAVGRREKVFSLITGKVETSDSEPPTPLATPLRELPRQADDDELMEPAQDPRGPKIDRNWRASHSFASRCLAGRASGSAGAEATIVQVQLEGSSSSSNSSKREASDDRK